jgi:hypothetical protein
MRTKKVIWMKGRDCGGPSNMRLAHWPSSSDRRMRAIYQTIFAFEIV